MIGRVLHIAALGFLQLVRARLYLNLVAAGVVLVVAALAFQQLSAGEGGRVLLDVGLAFESLVVAVLAALVPIVTLTRELELKQIHLVVSRPIHRAEVVVGRFLGAALLVVLSHLVLGGLLSLCAWSLGVENAERALLAALYSSFEGFLVAALAVFFGVGSSSTMSGVFVTILFVLGRLSQALADVVKSGKLGPASGPIEGVRRVLPDLTLFDLTAWSRGEAELRALDLAANAGSAVCTCAALILLASLRLSRRDLL